uniref:TSA: Wollemia nobilis Ref_Wollemi_Transcript_7625_2746 transcribed RNA sequence n=1 Tax=Wollemia nobilis TaxID=56998 RepID=A0A0C9RNU0_9CONI
MAATAVAVPPQPQVAELMENLKIGDQTKALDAPKAPAKDEKKTEVKSGAAPPNDSIGAKENKPLVDGLDHGPYYPANNYYGYYYQGHEAPGKEWDEQARFTGMDGLEMSYPGVHTENGSLVYYTPGYGYHPQTAYNPYNPYIPGAMMGGDGQFLGQRPFYPGPPYQHTVSSGFFPPSVHSNSQEPGSLTTGQTNGNGAAGVNAVHKPSEQDGLKGNPNAGGARPQGFRPMSQIQLNQQQGLGARGTLPPKDSFPFRKFAPGFNPGKVFMPFPNNNMVFKPNARGRGKGYGNKTNENWNFDVLSEQNRGPRTNRLRTPQISSEALKNGSNQGVVGSGDVDVNAINREQYNSPGFSIEHESAKFFVIKSYSEDDVHQSIKYNVWASTPNGNKKLDGAYEDAKKIVDENKSCPIFLFFSVNASGQFCGLAEMIGNVDFNKNMDFWQQDKWNGFFPVKWHMIKDIPNSQFRQIILENNDNKPVTNSRDTQEIKYVQGIEMLKIFKNYSPKTSILDDFGYYEARQRAMKEKKSRQQAQQQQQQQVAFRNGVRAPKTAADNMSKGCDVKAPEFLLPMPSANGNKLSDSNDVKKADSGLLDETKEAVESVAAAEPKKHDSEEICIKGSGVLIVGSVPC